MTLMTEQQHSKPAIPKRPKRNKPSETTSKQTTKVYARAMAIDARRSSGVTEATELREKYSKEMNLLIK